MLKHGIRSGQIREVLEKGERIESYPEDTPLRATCSRTSSGRYCTWASDDQLKRIPEHWEPLKMSSCHFSRPCRRRDHFEPYQDS